MIKLWTRTLRGGGVLGSTVMLAAVSLICGCSNSGLVDSSLDSRPDAAAIGSGSTPRSDPRTNLGIGAASWYGPGFQGKKTASGDIFDESKFTAAHKTLPLGHMARVTHLGNGKAVDVLINDRGPYVEGRIIDLSRAAAKAIGLTDSGLAKVKVELLY